MLGSTQLAAHGRAAHEGRPPKEAAGFGCAMHHSYAETHAWKHGGRDIGEERTESARRRAAPPCVCTPSADSSFVGYGCNQASSYVSFDCDVGCGTPADSGRPQWCSERRHGCLQRAMASSSADLVLCDCSAHCALLLLHGSKTSWCFTDQLEEKTSIPAQFASFVLQTTKSIDDIYLQAARALQNGVLGEYQEMMDAAVGLEAQRAKILDKFESTKPRPRKLREAWKSVQQKRRAADDASVIALAQRVAASLQRENHAIIDDFLPCGGSAAMGLLLRGMHRDGELQHGKVKSGVNADQRSDLMSWVPAVGAQPPALRTLLTALDRLLLFLVQRPEVAEDLGGVPLMRAEAQCTVYPGSGSRYVRHTDDCRQVLRKLTCIFYANPKWTPAAGGALRVYLPQPDGLEERVVDVPPLDNRLIIFYSDSRVPHEVLPAHENRYAVSVWYHDARKMVAMAND